MAQHPDRFYVGIDAGSVSLNCIVINNNKKVVYELPYQRHLGKVEEGVCQLYEKPEWRNETRFSSRRERGSIQ